MKSPNFHSKFQKQSDRPAPSDSQENMREKPIMIGGRPAYTGRYFMIMPQMGGGYDMEMPEKVLTREFGMKIAQIDGNSPAPDQSRDISNADAWVYPDLGVALVGAESEEVTQKLQALSTTAGYEMEAERIVYLPDTLNVPSNTQAVPKQVLPQTDSWNITQVNVPNSSFTGKGVKVAILDTGFNASHGDFSGRSVFPISCVPGQSAADLQGHGSHCVGVASGNRNPNKMRYGIAYDADIYSIKVLNDAGRGAQAWILNGMTQAVQQGCKVMSMSLGSASLPGQSYSAAYERAAQYAMMNNCLVVAAAGNDSRRSKNIFAPVGSPADSPSVIAVGAVDNRGSIADFSARGINLPYGAIDLVAPGVDIFSCWLNSGHNTISGTSMATPHVAGILALLWEEFPSYTAGQIRKELFKRIKAGGNNQDYGMGFCMV